MANEWAVKTQARMQALTDASKDHGENNTYGLPWCRRNPKDCGCLVSLLDGYDATARAEMDALLTVAEGTLNITVSEATVPAAPVEQPTAIDILRTVQLEQQMVDDKVKTKEIIEA